MQLSCDVRSAGDVTLVHLRATNDAPGARQVTIANRLDGPLWPPHTDGRPARGWVADGYRAVLAAGETRALGYATPAPASDPAAEVTTVDPVGTASDEARAVLRDLGDPRPPRDAVPETRGANERKVTR